MRSLLLHLLGAGKPHDPVGRLRHAMSRLHSRYLDESGSSLLTWLVVCERALDELSELDELRWPLHDARIELVAVRRQLSSRGLVDQVARLDAVIDALPAGVPSNPPPVWGEA